MVPEKVSRRLYIYSLKMRDLLMEQIRRLESECLELRRHRDELQKIAEQAGQQIAQLKQERDQAQSIRPASHEAVAQDEMETLLQLKVGRSLLAWRSAVVQARERHRQAEQAFAALSETNSAPVRALLYDQLLEAGDAVFEAIDAPTGE